MPYVKVSIPRNEAGGSPAIKDPTIIIVETVDVTTEPSRVAGTPTIATDYSLKEGAKAVGVYATPSTIEITRESNGEVDGRSLIKGVAYTHPGDTATIEGHLEYFLNKPVIIFVKECDGSASGRVRVVGSVCNPLYLQPEYTNSNEAVNNRFVWKQEQGDRFGVADYTGALPTLATEAVVEQGA